MLYFIYLDDRPKCTQELREERIYFPSIKLILPQSKIQIAQEYLLSKRASHRA